MTTPRVATSRALRSAVLTVAHLERARLPRGVHKTQFGRFLRLLGIMFCLVRAWALVPQDKRRHLVAQLDRLLAHEEKTQRFVQALLKRTVHALNSVTPAMPNLRPLLNPIFALAHKKSFVPPPPLPRGECPSTAQVVRNLKAALVTMRFRL